MNPEEKAQALFDRTRTALADRLLEDQDQDEPGLFSDSYVHELARLFGREKYAMRILDGREADADAIDFTRPSPMLVKARERLAAARKATNQKLREGHLSTRRIQGARRHGHKSEGALGCFLAEYCRASRDLRTVRWLALDQPSEVRVVGRGLSVEVAT